MNKKLKFFIVFFMFFLFDFICFGILNGWMLDTRYWILHIGCWMLDGRCSILDSVCSLLDFGALLVCTKRNWAYSINFPMLNIVSDHKSWLHLRTKKYSFIHSVIHLKCTCGSIVRKNSAQISSFHIKKKPNTEKKRKKIQH